MANIPNWKKNKIARVASYNKEHYVKITLNVPPEFKEELRNKAKAKGMSVTAFVMDCVRNS